MALSVLVSKGLLFIKLSSYSRDIEIPIDRVRLSAKYGTYLMTECSSVVNVQKYLFFLPKL